MYYYAALITRPSSIDIIIITIALLNARKESNTNNNNSNNNKKEILYSGGVLFLGIDCVISLPSFVPAERRLNLCGGFVQLRIGQVNVQQLVYVCVLYTTI